MEYRKVTEPAAEIRKIARYAARGNWLKLSLGVFICFVIPNVFGLLSIFIAEQIPFYRYLYDKNYYFVLEINICMIFAVAAAVLVFSYIYSGLHRYLLQAFRTRNGGVYGAVFSGLKNVFKAFGLVVLIYIKIVAWGLIVILPAGILLILIVSAYIGAGFVPDYNIIAVVMIISYIAVLILEIAAILRYSQSFFILADNPGFKIRKCIRESKMMMRGNKFKLLCLRLSFLGWVFLWIAFAALMFLAAAAFETVVIFSVVTVIGYIPLVTYIDVAAAAFYEIASGRLAAAEQLLPERHEFSGEGEGSGFAAYSVTDTPRRAEDDETARFRSLNGV